MYILLYRKYVYMIFKNKYLLLLLFMNIVIIRVLINFQLRK